MTTKKEKAMVIFSTKHEAWEKSREGQTDPYEYEKAYVEFMQKVEQEILQLSVGQEPDSRKNRYTSGSE